MKDFLHIDLETNSMSKFKVGDVVIFKGFASLGRSDWQTRVGAGAKYGAVYEISEMSGDYAGAIIQFGHTPIFFCDEQLELACGLARVLYDGDR